MPHARIVHHSLKKPIELVEVLPSSTLTTADSPCPEDGQSTIDIRSEITEVLSTFISYNDGLFEP